MNTWKFIFICVLFAASFFPNPQMVKGQTPCPRVGPCDNMPPITPPAGTIQPVPAPTPQSLTFADYMQEVTLYAVAMRKSFIRTVEGTLGGYFLTIAYWLAFIVFLSYFVKSAYNGAWAAGDIAKTTITLALCLMLLIYCGDADGDGVQGDLVNTLSAAGNSVAYGTSNSNSYIGNLVEYEQNTFDLNYKNFVDNKFFVRVNGADMPVKYPGAETTSILAAIYTGKTIDNPELKTKAESTEWQMGALFQLLNVGRGWLQFIDFFLLWLNGFLVITARLVCPFMVAVAVDPDLRKRMSLNFAWSLGTVTIVFPILTQIFRYIGYAAGNLGLGVYPTEHYFFYDPTTTQLVANGDPQIIIIIAAMLMFFAGFLLLFSLGIAFKLMQGSVLEGISSGISAAFTTLSSIGFGAVVSGYANRMQTQAEVELARQTNTAAVTGADYNKQAATVSADTAQQVAGVSADAAYNAKMNEAVGRNIAAKQGAYGTLENARYGIKGENYSSIAGALANYQHNKAGMDADEKKAATDNVVELMRGNNDADIRRVGDEISQEPGKLDLVAEQFENEENKIPVVGAALKTLGFGKDGVNAMTRGEDRPGLTGEFGTAVSKILYPNQREQLTNNAARSIPAGKMFGVGGNATKGMSRQQQEGYRQLSQLNQSDPNFLPTLNKMCERNGWNSNELLNTMAMESSFNKSNRGGDTSKVAGGNFVGLIQFGEGARQDVGLPRDVFAAQKTLAGMSATQQLPYVEKYLRGVERSTGVKLNQPGFVYGAIAGGSGAVQKAARNGGVVIQSGTAAYNAGGNRKWDNNGDGKITYGELSQVSASKLGAGQYFDVNNMLGQIRKSDKPTADVLAKQFTSDYQWKSARENNQMTFDAKNDSNRTFYDTKRGAELTYGQSQVDIANRKAEWQTSGANAAYQWAGTSADTTLGAEKVSAGIGRQGSLRAAEIQRTGSMGVANINYEREIKVADITKNAAIKAAYDRAVSNAVSNVGGNIVNQFSQSVEKFNRF